jgi:hypothetical protein
VTTAVAAGVALAKGDFALCDELCVEAERITRWAGYPPTLQMAFAVSACSRATQGDFAGAHAVLDDWVATGARGADRVRALVHAMAGDRNAIRPFRSRSAPDAVRLFDLAALATAIELGDLIDDLERIEWAADRIAGVAQAGVRFDMGWCFFLPRLAAVASARLGRDDDATRWFDLAEKEATRAGAVVEADRVARDRARLLGVAT